MEELSIRFYIKVIDKQNKVNTYRFGDEKSLLCFLQSSAKNELAIVDSHMAFYGGQLLSPAFGSDVGDIDHMDINLAKEWLIDGNMLIETANELLELTQSKKPKKDKIKKDKAKKAKKKSKKKHKKDK